MIEKKLKPAELAERSNTLAQLIEQIQREEDDLKEISADYRKRIKSLRLECSRLARVVNTGVELVDNQISLHEKGQ